MVTKGLWYAGDPALVGGVPRNVSVFNAKAHFGAYGDSNLAGSIGHDDTPAIQAMFDAIANFPGTEGGNVVPSAYFPTGYYHITGPITITPPGGVYGNYIFPRIYGEGMWHQTTIVCDGPTSGFVFNNDGASYQRMSTFSNMALTGLNSPINAINSNWSNSLILDRLLISGFTQEGIFFNNAIGPTVRNCYIYNCGNASHSQVRFNLSTVVRFIDNDVDQSATSMGGVSVERCAEAYLRGNAIESCGTPIIISGETENANACGLINIQDNDIENPTVGYAAVPVSVSVGKGLSTVFVRSVRVTGNNIAGNNANLAGEFGCDVAQCQQFEAAGNLISLSSAAGCQYNFGTSASVLSAIVRAQREEVGYTIPWVKVNGAQVVEATPYADWYSLQATSGLQFPKLVTTNPTATLVNKQSAQGGLYQIIHIGNAGGALTVNVTSDVPANSGYPMMLMPTDGNITLAHNNAVKGFFLKGLANLLLTVTNPVMFVYNSTTGKWHQL